MKITNKLMFLFIMLFILTSSIQAQSWKKNLKKLSDIAKDDSSTTEAVSMASSQDALLLQTAVALGSMANAQSFIAMAQGNQELAEQLSNVSKELTGGNISDIKGHVQLIQKTQETQLEIINNKEKMSEDAKKYYQKFINGTSIKI